MKRELCFLMVVVAVFGCGGSSPEALAPAPGGSKDPNRWPSDDRTMCDWKKNPALEVSETAGPGAVKPNVRRVYKLEGEKENRHKVLVCREIDTNLDGLKDVMRTFNTKGEAIHEEADTDFDGRVDVWADFINGRVGKEEVDTNRDGKADVWKFYADGRLARVKRNTHCPNGKPDTWEVYSRGFLERIGNDATCDGHVDRWDRDNERIAAQEEEARRVAAAAQDAGANGSSANSDAGSTLTDAASNAQ